MIANFTHNVPFRPFRAISLFKQQIANDLSDSQQFFWSFFSRDSLQKWFWLHIQFSLLLFFSIYSSETKRNRMSKYDIRMAKIAQITLRIYQITSHYVIYDSAFDCGTISFFVFCPSAHQCAETLANQYEYKKEIFPHFRERVISQCAPVKRPTILSECECIWMFNFFFLFTKRSHPNAVCSH